MTPDQKRDKTRETDRIIILKVKEGYKAKSNTGIVDPRLFSGGNRLHITKNLRNSLWEFKYDTGGVPEPLKVRFTRYEDALNHATTYFDRRNIEITQVID